MVAADGPEKRAPSRQSCSRTWNALFSHAYKLSYAEPGVSARRFTLSRGFNVLSIMTYAVDTLLSDSVDCGSIECCNFSHRRFSNTTSDCYRLMFPRRSLRKHLSLTSRGRNGATDAGL